MHWSNYFTKDCNLESKPESKLTKLEFRKHLVHSKKQVIANAKHNPSILMFKVQKYKMKHTTKTF